MNDTGQINEVLCKDLYETASKNDYLFATSCAARSSSGSTGRPRRHDLRPLRDRRGHTGEDSANGLMAHRFFC